jgi:hypothetical protein
LDGVNAAAHVVVLHYAEGAIGEPVGGTVGAPHRGDDRQCCSQCHDRQPGGAGADRFVFRHQAFGEPRGDAKRNHRNESPQNGTTDRRAKPERRNV